MNSTDLYLNLLKNCLTRYIYINEQPSFWGYTQSHIEELRRTGGDWPPTAETMVGLERLNNVEHCVRDIITNNIEGDLIETGIWRGGVVILMRAILKAYNSNKIVWAADSFSGVPQPDNNFPQDSGNNLWMARDLAVDLEQVKNNFKKYDLLDEQIKFLPGLFKDTLLHAPIKQLAVLRLDGDLYESTIEALEILYPKLSYGGYVIIDDYALQPCRQAVEDYRNKFSITNNIIKIDDMGVYWKKQL